MPPVRPILLSVLTAAAVSPVWADEYDTVNVTASSSITYDSNLFRLSDSASLPAGLGTSQKSDVITKAAVGLKIDKRYAQQRFQLDLTENVYRYSNFSFLNFEALDYRAAWMWHLTPRISGIVSAEREKSLVPFQDATGTMRVFQQALRTVENRQFRLDGMVSGPWHVLLGASQVSVDDSRIVTGEQSYSAVSQEAGLKYLAGSTSSIALVRRRLDGDYQQSRLDPINFLDNGFKEDQTELSARWVASGKSTFAGRVMWIDRTHEHFPQRDFDGLAGNLDYNWAATGKLRFTLTVRRELGTFWNQLLSSYRIRDSMGLRARWLATAHAEVGANVGLNESNYEGALAALAGPVRRDQGYRIGAYATWAPWRNVLLRIALDHIDRSSNFTLSNYEATIGSLTGSLSF